MYVTDDTSWSGQPAALSGAGDAVGGAQAGRGGGGGVHMVQAEQGRAVHRRDVDHADLGPRAAASSVPSLATRATSVLLLPPSMASTAGLSSRG